MTLLAGPFKVTMRDLVFRLRLPYFLAPRAHSIQMGSGGFPVGGFRHPCLEVAHITSAHRSLVNLSHMDLVNYNDSGKCSLTVYAQEERKYGLENKELVSAMVREK